MSYRGLTRRRDFNISASTTYAGELALPFMSAAISAGDTLANGWVRQMDNVHYKAVIPTLNSDTGILQAGSCTFNDGASTTLAERVVTLSELKVNEEICRGTVYPTWHGATGGRQTTDSWSTEFGNYLLALVAAKTAEMIELAIWRGISSTMNGFISVDGAAPTAAAELGSSVGATTVDIAGITAANAIAQFGLVYETAATSKPAILTKPDIAFFVSPKTFALYLQALATTGAADNVGQGYNNQVTNQDLGSVNYLGVPVRRCPGMIDNHIVLTYAENLVVGTNNGTDQSYAEAIPTYKTLGDDNVRVVMRMAIGTQTVTPADIIVGATWVSA